MASLIVSSNAAVTQKTHSLGKVYGQENLSYDKAFAAEYLALRNNFTDVAFQRIFSAKEDFTFSKGNKIDDLKGIRTDAGNYAVHLVYCDAFNRFCKFRINGVPTHRMYLPGAQGTNTFDIDDTYLLKINSAKFNQCDKKRFCHLGFEGYHTVAVSIERK